MHDTFIQLLNRAMKNKAYNTTKSNDHCVLEVKVLMGLHHRVKYLIKQQQKLVERS